MKTNRKIVIGTKVMTQGQLFKNKEKFRKVSALMPFEEKIKALVELQKIAYRWGGKKDVLVWI